jgi:hypothetical protein
MDETDKRLPNSYKTSNENESDKILSNIFLSPIKHNETKISAGIY